MTCPSYSIVLYTDDHLNDDIRKMCSPTIRWGETGELIVARANGQTNSMHHDDAITVTLGDTGPRTIKRLYWQMLLGCRKATNPIVVFAEHDVMYPDGYFDFMARVAEPLIDSRILGYHSTFHAYNTNWYWVTGSGAFRPPYAIRLMSQSAYGRQNAIGILKDRIKCLEHDPTEHFPHTEIGQFHRSLMFCAPQSCLDIRHSRNLTGERNPAEGDTAMMRVDYWGDLTKITETINADMAVASPA